MDRQAGEKQGEEEGNHARWSPSVVVIKEITIDKR